MKLLCAFPPQFWDFDGLTHTYGIFKALRAMSDCAFTGETTLAKGRPDAEAVIVSDPGEYKSPWWDFSGFGAGVRKVALFGDTWQPRPEHGAWVKREGIQTIVVRHQDDLESVTQQMPAGTEVLWLPYAYLPEVFYPRNVEKDCDVGLFGHQGHYYPLRMKAREILAGQTRFTVKDYTVHGCADFTLTGSAYAETVRRARIVIEGGVFTRYILGKHFEFAGSCVPMIAGYIGHGFDRIFQDRVHCRVCKDDGSDLLDIIGELLDNYPAAVGMAARAMYVAQDSHTEYHRAKALLRVLGDGR